MDIKKAQAILARAIHAEAISFKLFYTLMEQVGSEGTTHSEDLIKRLESIADHTDMVRTTAINDQMKNPNSDSLYKKSILTIN